MAPRLSKLPKLPETKHPVSMTVVFASTDIKSSDEDAAKFAIELDKFIDRFKAKSRIASRKISVKSRTYVELKDKAGE